MKTVVTTASSCLPEAARLNVRSILAKSVTYILTEMKDLAACKILRVWFLPSKPAHTKPCSSKYRQAMMVAMRLRYLGLQSVSIYKKDLVLTINVDEVMLVESSRRFSMAFEDGFHYGCFYAYLKLKEQEIANVTWLAELVTLQVSRQLPGWNKYVVPFKYHEDEVKRGNE